MSTHLKILSRKEIKTFDSPPEFSGDERKRFFYLSQWAEDIVAELRTPTNKVGFVLQLGYFAAVNKFFVSRGFLQRDIESVLRRLQIAPQSIDLSKYVKGTGTRHQDLIREKKGVRPFSDAVKREVFSQAKAICAKQVKPKLIFWSLVDYLREKKIEIPTYHALSEMISEAHRHFERDLVVRIDKQISPAQRQILNQLLAIDSTYESVEKQSLKLKRYKLTLLKKISQSTRPKRILENVTDLQELKALYFELNSLIAGLDLSDEMVDYYAQVARRSQIFQLSRREEKRYLLLTAFVQNQYYRLNDTLCEILLQSVQSQLSKAQKGHREQFYQTWRARHKTIGRLSDTLGDHFLTLKQITKVVRNDVLDDSEKVLAIKELLPPDKEESDYSKLTEQLATIGLKSRRVTKNEDYYDVLSAGSIKLQNRVSEIVKYLEFDFETSNQNLRLAIEYYREKDGQLSTDAPLEFLEVTEQQVVFDEAGKLRVSLYKVLLFVHLASAIKSGALNLRHSKKYRAFDDYLIPTEIWQAEKESLLARAGLRGFENFATLTPDFASAVTSQYQQTNEHIKKGLNKYARIDSLDRLRLTTPKVEKPLTSPIADLFPQNRFISVFEVLSTVNQLSNFNSGFSHWLSTHNRKSPEDKTFFAGIIAYGCNLGIPKLKSISKNIASSELENTVNWYFSPSNLLRANDTILELIDQLDLPTLYRQDLSAPHTASDGTRFRIRVESLNASYSYKYFGKDKGVSVYSFIDESHRLFYSTVINASEREAAYVIDGLMHNDVVESKIHSTDTDGYSEMVFGVTHLLGISFAPRIKNIKKQKLYSFEPRSQMANRGFSILPEKRINTKLIADHWDDILRLIATIKLKYTKASQLFRRLSSYSRQHPLYLAIKEFGRIIKTLFILKYIDDLTLRQAIEKQLNKLENSHRFGKAVFFGNNQEFLYGTVEEQLIAEGCKRLISNAIICWNYLYLTQLIANASPSQKHQIIATLKNGSPVAWRHVNLHGEYDFSEEKLKNSIQFRLPELLAVRVSENGR